MLTGHHKNIPRKKTYIDFISPITCEISMAEALFISWFQVGYHVTRVRN